jgi:hypothetical protein
LPNEDEDEDEDIDSNEKQCENYSICHGEGSKNGLPSHTDIQNCPLNSDFISKPLTDDDEVELEKDNK